MLCKCYRAWPNTIHVTAFCLGRPFSFWAQCTLYMHRVGQKSDTFFNYVSIMPDELRNTRCLYCSNNFNICF